MERAAASSAGDFIGVWGTGCAGVVLSGFVSEDWCDASRDVLLAVVKRVAMLPVIGLKIVAAWANSWSSRSHSSLMSSGGRIGISRVNPAL